MERAVSTLPTPGFTDQTKGLSFVDGEADAIDCFDDPFMGVEVCFEIFNSLRALPLFFILFFQASIQDVP